MSEVVYSTAGELARLIRERRASSVEVVEAHLRHIERRNPALNAIVTLDAERAVERAREADEALAHGTLWGPLHGVPVTVKDALETEGLRTTCSIKALGEYVPTADATAVARVRTAGAIILGKTNLPELASDVQTNSPIFGRTNNPWDPGRTPGGSTGGGGAALAAGLTPLEIASDVAGSIRIPSHYCGVYGLKPTEHLVPTSGYIPPQPGQPHSIRHLNVLGPLARSIADLRLCLALIAGPDGRDPDVPPIRLTAGDARPLPELRFAWTDDFGGVPVTAATRAALEGLAGTLAGLGCRVERCAPPGLDFAGAWQTYGAIFGAEIGVLTPALLRAGGRIMASTAYARDPVYAAILGAMALDMRRYAEALTRRDALIAALDDFLQQWDAWLCPVSSTPAFTHRPSSPKLPPRPIEVDDRRVAYWTATLSHTTVLSLTGNPCVVLPVARSPEGLPIGVQVVGRRWHDMELLDLAEKLEEVTGGFRRPPDSWR